MILVHNEYEIEELVCFKLYPEVPYMIVGFYVTGKEHNLTYRIRSGETVENAEPYEIEKYQLKDHE